MRGTPLIIDLNQRISITHKSFEVLNGREVLLWFDRTAHLMHIQDLESGHDSIIDLQPFGSNAYNCWNVPAGSIVLDGFCLIDSTGVLIAHEYQQNALYEVRRDTVIRHNFDLGNKTMLTVASNLIQEGSSITCALYGGKTKEEFLNASALVIRNMGQQNQEIEIVNSYPSVPLIDNSHLMLPSVGIGQSKVVSSFGFSTALQVTSLNSQTKLLDFPTLPALNLIDFKPDGVNANWISKFWQDHEAMVSIQYDPYRQQWLRVRLEQTDTIYQNPQEGLFRKDWSLLIYSSDFELVEETSFSGREFCHREVFPSPSGIWVGSNFITDYTFEFDSLKFTRFGCSDAD